MQGPPMWDVCISPGVVDLYFRIDPFQIYRIYTTCRRRHRTAPGGVTSWLYRSKLKGA